MNEILMEKDANEMAQATKEMSKAEKEHLLIYMQGFRAGQLMPREEEEE